MHAPVVGPSNPHDRAGVASGLRNHWSGHAEDAHLNSFVFDDQYHTFHSYGFAADPGGSGATIHASAGRAAPAAGGSVFAAARGGGGAAKRQKTAAGAKVPVGANFDPDAAPFVLTARQPWAGKEEEAAAELTEEQKEYVAALAADKAVKEAAEGKAEHSIFHGKAEKDFQGRSWLEPGAGERRAAASEACFLPKRCVHTWAGHSKGVNAVRFFPGTGHLLLSAGLDGAVKVWDVAGDRRCMRTYLGHAKGVRDAWFSHDGRRFATAAYDKTIKLWDTETGAVVG
jgi:pre-mRNA-processing factor 17